MQAKNLTAIQSAKEAISPQNFANEIRRLCLIQSKEANVGHIGSSLSIAELLAVLYSKILNIPTTKDPERDRFILSKGHAALALYAALHLKGLMSQDTLSTFCKDNSALGAHPENSVDGVDFATGSLGMGLSFGSGAALAAKKCNSKRRVFVIISDAELNEGSLWETALFAGHHQLSNLVAIVDQNGQQALGYTKDILDTDSIEAKFRAFKWRTYLVDGHDCDELEKTLKELDYSSGSPHVIIAKTIFGKGISYMENQIQWHYLPMDESQFKLALKEIGS